MNKLNFLIRKNKRSQQILYCKEKLAQILGIQLSEKDFIPLEKTDLLSNNFYTSLRASTFTSNADIKHTLMLTSNSNIFSHS